MKRRNRKTIPLLFTLLLSCSTGLSAEPVLCENIDVEMLLDEARDAAKNDENEQSAKLFAKLIKQAPDQRDILLREYADQLLYTDSAGKAIAYYYEILNNNPPKNTEKAIKRNLALALHWGGYHDDALRVYDELLSEDDRDRIAFEGRINLLIAVARDDYKYNRNQESAETFAEILAADPSKRREILREYADQLNYSGNPTDAVPLFYEVLSWDLSPLEEERARYGLALALRWSGQYDESLQYYDELVDEGFFGFGEDRFASDRTDTIIEKARQAASIDKNLESANLFNEAMQSMPGKRKEVLKEYADQLTFTNQPEEAIPLYQEVIENPKSPEEKTAAEKGLALALNWAGKLKDSLNIYDQLLQTNPNDTKAQQGRADVLTQMARTHAVQDQNTEATNLLQKAIAQDPSRRKDVLIELAEQMMYSDRAAEAVPLYHEVINGNPSPELEDRARKGLALALQWSGNYQDAMGMYDSMLDSGDDDPKVNKRYASAMIDAARKAARESRNNESAELFEKAIKRDPSRKREVLREYADQLTYAGRADESIPIFYEILASDPNPENARAARQVLGLALLWKERFQESLSVYDKLLTDYPTDKEIIEKRADVLVPLAREAATRDKNKEAATMFEEVIITVPERKKEVRKEWADQLTYAGNAKKAIFIYREGLDEELSDSDRTAYQVGLALALFWDGQTDDALTYYEQILAEDPGNPNARKGLANVIAMQAREQFKEGDTDNATSLMLQALTTDPIRRKEFAKELADMYTQLEKPFEAIPFYQEVLASSESSSEIAEAKRGLQEAQKQLTAYMEAMEECRTKGNFSRPEPEITAAPAPIEQEIALASPNENFIQEREVQPASTPKQRKLPIETVLDLSETLVESGAHKKAIQLLEETLGQSLNNQDRKTVLLQLAQITYNNGDVVESVDYYISLLNEDPSNPNARQGLANVYAEQAKKVAEQGDNEAAIILMEKAVAKDITRRSDLLRELADLYLTNGNPDEAISLYYEVLASSSSIDNQKKATSGLSKALIQQEKKSQNRDNSYPLGDRKKK